MAQILQDAGLPADAIAPEDQSTTTLENIRNAMPILSAKNAREVVIVTDRYHARRAAMVARHFGLRARTSSPQPDRMMIKAYIREGLALPIYAARLHIRRRKG